MVSVRDPANGSKASPKAQSQMKMINIAKTRKLTFRLAKGFHTVYNLYDVKHTRVKTDASLERTVNTPTAVQRELALHGLSLWR